MMNTVSGPAFDHMMRLLDPDRLPPTTDASPGYLDLIGTSTDRHSTIAQAAMHNPVVAAIYERWWRPTGSVLMGMHGPRMDAERSLARRTLHIEGEAKVLDVACGPGNFTRAFAESLDGEGIAIGLDVSPPMLDRAVVDNAHERAAYLRADARVLPFPDGSFDAVCCFAALYLVPEPFRVIDELLRVLASGGRIAVMTSCTVGPAPLRIAQNVIGGVTGIRMFGRNEVTDVFGRAGLTEIRQRVSGFAQFVSARKP